MYLVSWPTSDEREPTDHGPRGLSPRFGNVVIVLFFIVQALDGILTYIGVTTFGPSIEGNPILAFLIHAIGDAPALAGAKMTAAAFGIVLHLASVHRIVLALTAIYVGAAIIPWTQLLF